MPRASSVAMRGALVAVILLVVSSVGMAARTPPRGLISATSGHVEDAELGSGTMFDLFSKHANKFPFEPAMEGGAAGESGTCSFPKFESREPPDMVRSCNENALKGVQEFGGFSRESGDSPAALEVGKYATLKLNCARKHAETPCAPLVSAKVLEAYEHVTATQFWYVNISVGHNRLVKATVAVDEVLVAEDIDCPELAMNEFSPFNLIKLEEFADPNSDAPPVPVTDVCKFERESSAVNPPETRRTPSDFDFDFDLSDLAWLGEDPLGMRQLRVEGQPWNPPHVTSEERDAQHIMSALGGDDRALTGAVPAYTCDPPEKAPADFDPPKNFDLRDEYSYCKADHPGNQGQCGSCWAFGYSYMFSYRMCVQTKGRWNDVISQQQFVACEWGGSCGGGIDTRAATGQAEAWDTVKACPERSEFPYTNTPGDETCMSRDKAEIDNGQVRAYAPKMSTLVISEFESGRGTQTDCKGQRTSITKDEHIKWAMHQIMNYGPVTVVNNAGGMERSKAATDIHCMEEGGRANHMLIVVGWGETDAGDKYWLIQNSWGDTWKDNGRIKIDRGNNGCRIEERFGKVDADFDIMFDPASLTTPDCSNDGVIDWDTKKCVCKPPWKGPGVAGDEGHPGCEICGIEACANDGVFDADACACACKDGYGGPKCETSISANIAAGKLAATLRLGEFATVNSDVAVAVRVGESGEWKPVSDRGELCGEIVDGDPTPCPEVDDTRALKVNVDLAKKGITQNGQEIFVKFVQNLGLNEFGNPRGYEMDRYGKGLMASAGPYRGASCSDVTVTVTVPEGQYGKLSWTVGQGDGVSERVDMTLDGQAVVEEMSACLANEADHALKVTGHVNAGSAFDRFTAKVKQSDYDDAEIMSTGSVFAFPPELLFETPAADPSGGKKRRLEGAAPFRVWPVKPSGSKCSLVKVSVTASAFGNGAAANMMEFDLLPATKGEADTRLYAAPGSFAFGTTRHDVACVTPGKYAFVAGVSGHAFGAGGWGHGSAWSVSTLDGDELAGVPVEESADWFSSGEMKSSETFDVPGAAASAALGRIPRDPARRRALLATNDAAAARHREFFSLGSDAALGAAPLTAGLAAVAVVAVIVAGVAAQKNTPAASSSSSSLLRETRDDASRRKYGATGKDQTESRTVRASSSRTAFDSFGGRGATTALICAVALVAFVAVGTAARGGSLSGAAPRAARVGSPRALPLLPSAPGAAVPSAPGPALPGAAAVSSPAPAKASKGSDYFDDYGDKNLTSGTLSNASDYGEEEDGGAPPADGGSITFHFDDYDHDDDHDLAEGDYAGVDDELKALLARLSSGVGCGKGVSPCFALHAPDCRSPRTYLYSPGVVAELHPNGKVLHPLDSIAPDAESTHQVVERVTCPAGVAEDEVCVTKHRAAIEDVSVLQCREACDRTELCVAFTHHAAADDVAKVGGYGHACTLLAGVSGDGAVARASAGSNADDVAGEPRGRLRGHATYFLQPEGVDLSQMDGFKHLKNPKCETPAAGANVAEEAPKECVVVDENYESAVAAMGARFNFFTSTKNSIPSSPFDVESLDTASEPHSGDDEEGYTFDWPIDWDNWPPKRNKPPPPPPMSPPPAPIPGSYAVLAWASVVNDGAPVTIDTITVEKPPVGAKIVAGTPLRYVVCEDIADASFTSTSKCGGVVADSVWLVKLPGKGGSVRPTTPSTPEKVKQPPPSPPPRQKPAGGGGGGGGGGGRSGDYPADPPGNVDWPFSDWAPADIQTIMDKFNAARARDPTVSVDLVIEYTQDEWDALSDNEKGLYLSNKERIDRGIAPYAAVAKQVSDVAEDYAAYLYEVEGTLTHRPAESKWTGSGRDASSCCSPQDRLAAALGDEKEFFRFSENLAWTSAGTPSRFPEPVAYSVYSWIYDDGPGWGHRHFSLAALNDNAGEANAEGLLGFGVARGVGGTYTVMNVADEAAGWDYATADNLILWSSMVRGDLGAHGDAPASDETFEACGVTVTAASTPADIYVPLPKDFTLADGSQPATPKKHWSYIERADAAFDPAAPPPPKPKEHSPPPPLPPPKPMQPAYPGNPPPLPSPPPAPHPPPSPPPPDPFAALVERKLRRLESYRSAAALSERADEALPRKIQRRLAKLEAFAEMYELNGETLPDPVPKFVQPKKANKRGQKSCADLEWPVGNPTRYPFVCGASSAPGAFECDDAATFDEAVKTCTAAGARLCRNNEVTAAGSGSDCQADDAMVWTHRPCGEGKYQQRPANGGEGVCVSSAKENLAAVRCCSNRE